MLTKKFVVNAGIALALIALVVGSVIALSRHVKQYEAANQQDHWQQIKNRGEITIGLDDTFVPMGFRDKNGQLTGFDIDLANQTFANLGIKVKWQPINWSMKETELKGGKIDAIWNGYTVSDERKAQVAFSTPYHQGNQAVVSLQSDNITTFADMKGKVLADQTASSSDELLNAQPAILRDMIKDQKAVGYETFDKAFTDLNARRVTGILTDLDYANYYVKHQPNSGDYRIITGNYPKSDFAVGFRKQDNGLREAVNAELAKLKANGQLAQIEQRWFGQ